MKIKLFMVSWSPEPEVCEAEVWAENEDAAYEVAIGDGTFSRHDLYNGAYEVEECENE